MGLISFIVLCVVLGLIVYLVTTYLPLDQKIKLIIIWATVFVLLLVFLQATGVLGNFDVMIPRIR